MPPVLPMLAKPVKTIPEGQHYEPKWDGFRAIIFRDGDEVEIGSRNTKPMTRYFPEVVEALREHLPPRCVIDGEIIVAGADGHGLDFEALQQRIHPAVSPGEPAGPGRPRRASSPSTCSRSATTTSPPGRSPSAGPRWRARSGPPDTPRCTSPR